MPMEMAIEDKQPIRLLKKKNILSPLIRFRSNRTRTHSASSLTCDSTHSGLSAAD
jgi:hypothetical protein